MQPAEVIGHVGPAAPEEGGARRPLAWLAETFVAERERWPLWIPVLVGSGIGLYFWLRVEPPLLLGPLALALALAAAAAAVALGFAAAQFQAWWVSAPILAQRIGPATVEARIVAVDPLPEGTRLVLEPRSIAGLAPAALPARIRVKVRQDPAGFVPGTWLRLRVGLLPPPGPAMPGAYDFQRRAYFDRLGAVGFAYGAPVPIAAPAGAGPGFWRSAVESLRASVGARIRAALPGPTGAVAAALVTGETTPSRPPMPAPSATPASPTSS
jgi:competence protein ComEC